jgi:succinoglycan biosynthesis protein ExoA
MRDEEAYIRACLQSVVDQEYPKELTEVLVIDGMSCDASRSIVEEFTKKYSHVKLLDNPQQTTTHALNLGVLLSVGDVIVRVDAHSCIDRDYLRCVIDAFKRTGADNVGGLMRPVGKSFLQRAIAFAMRSPFGVGTSRFHYCEKEMFVDTVYLGAYRREVFEKIGLYDPGAHYAEDDELNYRLVQSGGRILLSPAIKSHYFPRRSLPALWRQYFNYGRGKVRTSKKHHRPPSWTHLAPSAFVLAILGSLGFWNVTPFAKWVFAGVAAGYLVAVTAATVAIAVRQGLSFAALMPPVFFTMHAGYGTGFVAGVLRLTATGKVW